MIAVETHQQTTKRWSIDPARSSVDFAVGTFWGLGTVSGRFGRIDGVYSDGPAGAKIELTVDAGTIDTGNVARDEHFRSWDLSDVVRHRYVRFTSTEVVDTGGSTPPHRGGPGSGRRGRAGRGRRDGARTG